MRGIPLKRGTYPENGNARTGIVGDIHCDGPENAGTIDAKGDGALQRMIPNGVRHLFPRNDRLFVHASDLVTDLYAGLFCGIPRHYFTDTRAFDIKRPMSDEEKSRQEQRKDHVCERSVEKNEKTFPGRFFHEGASGGNDLVPFFLQSAEAHESSERNRA